MEFYGPYWFLSNSSQYPLNLDINGKTYRFKAAECAYLACKSPENAEILSTMTPKDAKALGKKFKKKEIREDWEEIKLIEMKRVLTAKFKDPALRQKLLQTPSPITMDNPYHDTYWGLYNGKGRNILGKMLDEVKEDILVEMGIILKKESSVVSYKIQQGGLVAFDTETTGLSSKYDDILQITIVGQDGAILLNTYVKPISCTHWEDAERIHGISPDMVKNAPSADKVAAIVKKIFDNADKIIGYNVGFDTKMVSARFGYDFDKKENEAREKYPEKWKEKLERYKEIAKEDRDLYKNAVEEMNYLSLEKKKLRAELKEEFGLSSVKDIDTYDFPAGHEKYVEYVETLDYIKNAEKVINERKKNRCFKVMESLGIPLEEATDEDIESHIRIITEPLSLEDILPLYKRYTCENDVPHKLIDAMKDLYPDKADKFILEAHDAGADTLATMEVAKKLYEYFEMPQPIGKSIFEDKLFGISEGIVCHQVSTDGISQKGFSTRMYGQFPKLRREYRSFIADHSDNPDEMFGKIKIDEVDNGLFVASIFSRHTQGNAELTGIKYTDESVLVNRISAICDKFSDKPVYLPVIISADGTITDGIGAGKGGGNWNNLESRFKDLDKDNLYFLDTQTGDIKKVKEDLVKADNTDLDEEEDGIEL